MFGSGRVGKTRLLVPTERTTPIGMTASGKQGYYSVLGTTIVGVLKRLGSACRKTISLIPLYGSRRRRSEKFSIYEMCE